MRIGYIYDCAPHFAHFALKFTGKERDAESGLDFLISRYYSSSIGRFMSPDWSANPISIPFARLDNPQTLNIYDYVGNNPLRYRDSFGHSADCDHDGDKSVVCLVTSAWDWLKKHLGGGSDSSGNTPAPAPAPATVPESDPGPQFRTTSRIISAPDYYSFNIGAGFNSYTWSYVPKTNNLFFTGGGASSFKLRPGAGVSAVAGWSLSRRPEDHPGANAESYLGARGVSGCFFDVVGGCVGYSPGGGGWAVEAGLGIGGGSMGAGYALDWNSYVQGLYDSMPVQIGTTVNVQGLAVPDPQDPTNW